MNNILKEQETMKADMQWNLHKAPIVEVSVDRMDLAPGPFTMSYGFDLQPMKLSIKRAGLLNLPLLLESGAGRLIIVSGYRRIAALLEMDFKHLPARILKEREISSLDVLLINFFDNLATREFNSVEKGMALSRLANHFSAGEILSHYMALLGLPSRQPTLENYISFDRDLDESLKRGLVEGRISEPAAKALLDLMPEERKAVGQLFLDLTFTINQQKQLIELLKDISRTKRTSMADVLQEQRFLDIRSSHSLNGPQKTKSLLALLRLQKFPRLSRAEETFKKEVLRLQLPRHVRVQAPSYFESEFYRMEISFRNGKELKDVIDHLAGVDGLRQLGNPWEKVA
jgi:hypothetical protein